MIIFPATEIGVQDTLNVSATPTVQPVGDGKPIESGAFGTLQTKLHDCIVRQSAAFVAFYAERGDICLEALNVKLGRAMDKPTRDKARANGMTALLATAMGACDETSEASPQIAKWLNIAGLVKLFPTAVNLPSVKVALAVATTISRIDPPATWDAPEAYYVRPRFDAVKVAELIGRAVEFKMSADAVATEIEYIGGRIKPEDVTEVSVDPVAAGQKLAESVVTRIMDGDVNGFAFFDRFVAYGAEFGLTVRQESDGKGSTVVKMVVIS